MLCPFETIFQQYGYQPVSPHINGLFFHFRQEREIGYIIVTIDETCGIHLTHDQLVRISWQFRDFLMERECTVNHFLYLLVTDDPSSGKRLFDQQECYWLVDVSERQLMVFEDSDPYFETLRRPIEDYLLREPAKAMDPLKRSRPDFLKAGTLALLLANVAVFLLTSLLAPFLASQPWEQGALYWGAVLQDHQYYRLLTSMFLHQGADHLFNNMLVLLLIGTYVERKTGTLSYLILYFSSGLLAGCTSMVYNMWQGEHAYSVGASGALFGIMGALLCIVLFKRDKQEYNLRQILFLAAISLYGGLVSQGVDNAAHIGGFISGFLVACLLIKKRQPKAPHADPAG